MKNLKNRSIIQLILTLSISVAALIGAYIIEYGLKVEPCILCTYERYPYFIAIGLSLIGLINKKFIKITILLLFLTFISGAALSFYHLGVESKIFTGTTACNSQTQQADNIEELRSQLNSKTKPSCSIPAIKFIGISLTGWNLLLSIMVLLSFINYFKQLRTTYDNKITR